MQNSNVRRTTSGGRLDRDTNDPGDRSATLALPHRSFWGASTRLRHGLKASLIVTLTLGLFAPRAALSKQRLEVGAFGGMHLFSEDNELGVADNTHAHSFANSFAGGLRAATNWTPTWMIELELAAMPTSQRLQGDKATVWGVRGQLLYSILRPGSADLFALVGANCLLVSPSEDTNLMSDVDAAVHAGLGLKWHLSSHWLLRTDLRISLPPAIGTVGVTTDFEGQIGLSYAWDLEREDPTRDSDHDQIPDITDLCPFEPENRDGVRDNDGCPEKAVEEDQRAPKSDDEATHSKNKSAPPALPPLQPPRDSDRDGLDDQEDLCPKAAEDKDGFEDADGCPDPDNDRDRVPDPKDKCPMVAETPNGYQDDDGCPDEVPVQIKKFTGVIEGIYFKSSSAIILRRSYRTLDAAMEVLRSYPQTHLRIEGHTDDRGQAELNLKLSTRRAEAVKAYFISKGIAEGRLNTVGFGQRQPIADNNRKKGRAKNRRVVFKLVSSLTQQDQKSEPTQSGSNKKKR